MVADPVDILVHDHQPTVCRSGDEELYLELAATNKAASFSHVAVAHFSKSPYEVSLVRAFERKHGKIAHIHFWDNAKAALVSTEKDEICVHCHAGTESVDPEIERLIDECEMLHFEARRLLNRGRDLRTCSELSFSLIFHLLGLADRRCDHRQSRQPMLDEDRQARTKLLNFVQTQIRQYRKVFSDSAQRQAQFHYFTGMFWGIALIGAAIACLVGAAFVGGSHFHMQTWFATAGNGAVVAGAGCFIAGALGAIISVTSRLGTGTCKLDYRAGKSMLHVVGGVRPWIGGVFGVASFMVFQAGLLSLTAPTGTQNATAEPTYNVKALLLFWSLAFLAGFSERWARDMLNLAGHTALGDPATSSTPGTTGPGKPARSQQ